MVDYWYINLDSSKERKKHIESLALPFKRWVAINGKDLSIKATSATWNVEGGKLGCYLSFLSFFMYAQEHTKSDRIFLIEDDVKLPNDIEVYINHEYPIDWDMVYFYNFEQDKGATEIEKINGKSLVKSKYPIGNPALLLNVSSLHKLISALSKVDKHKDHQIATAISEGKINAYAIVPNIISLEGLKSTIC